MNQTEKPTRYVTPTVVARKTGVDPRTIRRALEDGRIVGAFKTPGGHWRVPTRTVDAWIGELTTKDPDAHDEQG